MNKRNAFLQSANLRNGAKLEIHALSMASVLLTLCKKVDYHQGKIQTNRQTNATGFLWRNENTLLIITNWHVVTGINNNTDTYLSDWAPDLLSVPLRVFDGTKKGDVKGSVIHEYFIELYDESGNPRWLEHPIGRLIDCIALPIGEFEGYEALATPQINEYPFVEINKNHIGTDCFVVGYPMNVMAPHGLPIWKRASIASEIEADYNGLPLFLVDTATRTGMSGSPVIGRLPALVVHDGEIMQSFQEQFLGIYSGRIDDDTFGAQLGRVWKARVVREIVSKKIPGKLPKVVHNMSN